MPATVISFDPFPPYLLDQLKASFDFHYNLDKNDLAALEKLAPHVRAVVAKGETVLTGELMARLPKLELVSVYGVGYDGIDVAAARQRGIAVTNTPEVLTDEVADLAIALMLAVARRVADADRFVRSGAWATGTFPLTRKVSGSRLGMVGLGRIGQAIAKRAEAFGMSVAYTARGRKAALPYAFYATPEALAKEVDFLIVATFGGPTTRGLVSAEVINALGPDGYLINIARGSVIDEPALVAALQEKRIAGAGLDVFVNEPNVPAALLGMDNVVLTPHIGSATVQTRAAMADLACANLRAHFEGRPLLTPIPA
jgi:hydroxypyruvate reductase